MLTDDFIQLDDQADGIEGLAVETGGNSLFKANFYIVWLVGGVCDRLSQGIDFFQGFIPGIF